MQPVVRIAAEAHQAPESGTRRDSARQTLRLRRYLIGAGTSLLVAVALFVCYWLGLLPMNVAVGGTALIGFFVVLFYGLFRSGLNLRFSDPSLTTEMIAAAVLTLAYIMYHAAPVRNALSLFYLVALMFGVLRLGTTRLVALALMTLIAHAVVLAMSGSLQGPGAAAAWTQLGTLTIVLPWFATMGGYVNSLRHRLSDANRQLKLAVTRAEEVAIRDALTGAYNRRHLMDVLQRELGRTGRIATTLSVCLIDVDHFKSINDTLGHAAGDEVLKHLASVAGASLRVVDVFGRYGGEEFLLIMPDTQGQGAAVVAERLRADIEQCAFPGVPAERRISVTIGVASHAKGDDVGALVDRADQALYRGKSAGRNRVVVMA